MKIFISAIVFCFAQLSICLSQTQTIYVQPILTDNNYAANQDSNYVVRNSSNNLNKLVLFIGGSYSSPDSYSIFCQNAATLGFDVISICYPNNVASAPLGGSADSMIFNTYRQEVCFGTPVSGAVTVDTLNSIFTRTLKLIQYLASNYPLQNWGQYLITPNNLDWTKIIVSGHSQGSGHACYLAKQFLVDRVLMFSGPNDYSTYYNNSANWLRQPGLTPILNHFALLHLQDEIVPFGNQFINLSGLGMLMADDSTLVDNLNYPFANSHFLYTNIPAFSYHSATIGAHPTMPAVWAYLLTSPLTTPLNDQTFLERRLEIYPNPVAANLTIKLSDNRENDYLKIYNGFGELIHIEKINDKKIFTLNTSEYKSGLYFIHCGHATTKFIKK
jgi:hypothetical protein